MTDPRQISLSEALSVLKDGEINELELRQILNEVDLDPSLRRQWDASHAIGAVLRRETSTRYEDISARVSAGIADEVPHRGIAYWKKPLQQFAVAASMAAVTLLAVQLIPGQQVSDSTGEVLAAADNIYQDEPMVQFPTGLELPGLSTRNVSTAPASQLPNATLVQSRPAELEQYPVNLNTFDEQALRRHFDRVLFEHNSNAASAVPQSAIPLARVPGLELEQE